MSDEKLPIEKAIDNAQSATTDFSKAVIDNLTFDSDPEPKAPQVSDSRSESK